MEYQIFARSGKIIEKSEQCDLTPTELQKIEDIAAEISEHYHAVAVVEITMWEVNE